MVNVKDRGMVGQEMIYDSVALVEDGLGGSRPLCRKSDPANQSCVNSSLPTASLKLPRSQQEHHPQKMSHTMDTKRTRKWVATRNLLVATHILYDLDAYRHPAKSGMEAVSNRNRRKECPSRRPWRTERHRSG